MSEVKKVKRLIDEHWFCRQCGVVIDRVVKFRKKNARGQFWDISQDGNTGLTMHGARVLQIDIGKRFPLEEAPVPRQKKRAVVFRIEPNPEVILVKDFNGGIEKVLHREKRLIYVGTEVFVSKETMHGYHMAQSLDMEVV